MEKKKHLYCIQNNAPSLCVLKDCLFNAMIYLERKQMFWISNPLFININSINYEER